MVIVTNGEVATVYFSESEWLDGSTINWPAEDWAFRVPNSTPASEILGGIDYDPETKQPLPPTPPMTQAAVAAIATEVIFQPASVKD